MYKQTGFSSHHHDVYRSLASTHNPSIKASWDGMKWVQSAPSIAIAVAAPVSTATTSPRVPRPSTDLPKIPSRMTSLDPDTTPVSELVTHFSEVYQHYSKQIQSYKANGDLGTGLQWAEYYADLSTRAAHHYNDLANQQQQKQHDQQQQRQNDQPSQRGSTTNTNANTTASTGGAPPNSFREYAHRNLSRCETRTHKSAMTELIQLTIRRALKDGSMHTKQWQLEPLLPLPSTHAHSNVHANDATVNDHSKDAFIHRHNSSSSHSSFNSSSSTNHNNNHNNSHKNNNNNSSLGKGKSFSYLDAVKGKNNNNNNNNNNKRKSWSDDHLNNNNNTSTSSSSNGNNSGTQTKKKKKTGNNSSSYEATLPVNDSYYGSPATNSFKYNTTSAATTMTTATTTVTTAPPPPQYPYRASPHVSPLKEYDAMLPSNDSYYGRSTSHGSSTITSRSTSMTSTGTSTSTIHNSYPYTTDANANVNRNNNNRNNNSGDIDHNDDFISLSSLSTTKYIKKNNKLIKASSYSSSLSTSNNGSSGKKKKKSIKGMTNNNNNNDSNSSKSKLASRLNRFSGQGGLSDAASSNLHSEYSQGVERYMGKTVIGGTTSTKKLDEEDYENMTVKGTCVILEKEYLRLTAPPRAELVRPQPILHTHLVNLKNQWKQYRNATTTAKTNTDTNSGKNKGKDNKKKKKKQKDYAWFCSQLKAMRQDLTVQRIFNAFAVDVYETHAKFALIEGDLNEYNQSQTQLKELYELVSHSIASSENGKSKLKLKSKSSSPNGKGVDSDCCNGNDNGLKNQNEFIAYRIIYYVLLTGNKKYEGGSSDIFKIMLNLTPEQRKDPSIVHALKVRVAVADNDYHAFFRLQDTCPNIGSYLMDMMLDHVRGLGLQCMVKAYRPSLSTHFMLEELGFSFNGELDVEEGITWLRNYGCKFNEDESLVLTKDSVLNESNLIGKKVSSLI